MRPFLFTLLLLASYPLFARNTTFEKLQSINRYWSQQPDVNRDALPECNEHSRTELISLHLQLVEQTLRKRDVSSLTALQRKNRLLALGHLHEYILAGRFPQNEDYNYPTPIFIDKHDNFCAVGYLVKATGHEAVSRMIAAKTNLAYVADMQYPELFAWAKEYGFTVSELEWIQPTYSPMGTLKAIGKGTDGVVNELFTDSVANVLYVGGQFTQVDSSISSANIAAVTEASGVYTWHGMKGGVNGTVYAITTFGSNVFVGGQFTQADTVAVNNIAYWDGSNWHKAGCLNGIVKDLIVFNNDLYASGDFSNCSSSSNVCLAKWNGINWIGITGLSGRVNTLEVVDTNLFLGGRFSYGSAQVNAIKWNAANGFQAFSNSIGNEVMDFESFDTSFYAVCKQINPTDSMLMYQLAGNTWAGNKWASSFTDTLAFNTLCKNRRLLMFAGDFYYVPNALGYYLGNCFLHNYPGEYFEHWFAVSDPINKLVVFNGKIIAGGKFKGAWYNTLNGIGVYSPNIPDLKVISQMVSKACQPTGAGGTIIPELSGGVSPIRFLWSTGDTTDTLSDVPPGTYTLYVVDDEGRRDTASFTVGLITINTTLSYMGTMLVAKVADSFAWMECNTNTIIPNETLPEYIPTKTGSYAVIMSIKGCKDTSICYADTIPDSTNSIIKVKEGVLRLYPNPVSKELNVKMQAGCYTELRITDITGRVLKHETIGKTTDHIKVDVGDLPQGIFMLELKDATGNQTIRKFSKE